VCTSVVVIRNVGDAALEGAQLKMTINGGPRTAAVPTLPLGGSR
jgi:hypothetical protein